MKNSTKEKIKAGGLVVASVASVVLIERLVVEGVVARLRHHLAAAAAAAEAEEAAAAAEAEEAASAEARTGYARRTAM